MASDKDTLIHILKHNPKADNIGEKKMVVSVLSDMPKPPPRQKSWGFHLLVDCSGLNEKIDSEEDVRKFFDELLTDLGMKKLTDFVYKKVDNKEEGRGLSAFQMITTSHISMHFDDEGRTGYLDIFSCKTFEPIKVVKMIEKHFKPKHITSDFIYRDAGLQRSK